MTQTTRANPLNFRHALSLKNLASTGARAVCLGRQSQTVLFRTQATVVDILVAVGVCCRCRPSDQCREKSLIAPFQTRASHLPYIRDLVVLGVLA
jgi:hypothetical protein